MISLFSCIYSADGAAESEVVHPTDFEPCDMDKSATPELDGMLYLTENEVNTLIMDFSDSKNLSAALSISSRCIDYRPAWAALYDLCRSAITNFEVLGNEGKCILLLQILRAHRELPEVVLLSLGAMLCLMQSELNSVRFLENNVCDDLEWILQHYKWSHKVPDSTCPSCKDLDAEYVTYNVRLRVVGWTMQLIRLISRNHPEGRLVLANKAIHTELHTYLDELLKFLRHGDDLHELSPPGAGREGGDLYTVFCHTRTPSIPRCTTHTHSLTPPPDYSISLSRCLRHPVNFFAVCCCDVLCELGREGGRVLQQYRELRLPHLLEAGSLPTRQSLYIGASEDTFAALRRTRREVFDTADCQGAGGGGGGEATPAYFIEKDLVVQVRGEGGGKPGG